MIKEGNFGYHEAISLLVITIVTKVFFTSPAILVEIVGTSGWYMTIISMLVAIFAFMFLYLLLKRFPQKHNGDCRFSLREIREYYLLLILGGFYCGLPVSVSGICRSIKGLCNAQKSSQFHYDTISGNYYSFIIYGNGNHCKIC